MSSGFESVLNDMLAELERQRQSMTHLQQSMATATGSATSARRQVTVSVDARGEITELKFLGLGYRSLPPKELAEVIVSTIRDARRDVRERLADQVADTSVAGAELSEMMDGSADWGKVFTDALTVPPALLDMMRRPPTDLLDGLDLPAMFGDAAGGAAPGGTVAGGTVAGGTVAGGDAVKRDAVEPDGGADPAGEGR